MAREREKQALSMRRAGATYAQIADAVGYGTPSNAHRAVFRALDRIPTENAEQLRIIESARLDAIQTAHWRPAVTGNPANARIVLKVMERRAKLWGLDAPTRVESTPDLDAEIKMLAAQLDNDGSWNVTGVPDSEPDSLAAAVASMEDSERPLMAALDELNRGETQ